MKPLVIIPARGGSKGLPGKNIKLLAGKPLINYTIEAAREIFDDEIICVSTDDHKIKSVAEDTGLYVPFIRPAELATDSVGTYEFLLHAVNFYESNGYFADTLILLQPTSPFRTGQHIKEALTLFDENCDMVVSVKKTKANPYYVLFEEKNGWLEQSKDADFIRRQDCPTIYELNGAIYIYRMTTLKNTPINKFINRRKFVMEEWSSHDIDTILDWEIAEVLVKKLHKNKL
jgi:CMP-N,N'-diacetyllegionaminic acid synthase